MKNRVKTLKSKIAVPVVAAALTMSTLVAQPAKAFFLVAIPTAVVTNNAFNLSISNMNGGEMFVCAILLPFCVLGEKGQAQGQVTEQDLISNGYSQSEARDLVIEATDLTAALNKSGQRLVISPDDTEADIAKGVRQVKPDASNLLIQFLMDRALVK